MNRSKGGRVLLFRLFLLLFSHRLPCHGAEFLTVCPNHFGLPGTEIVHNALGILDCALDCRFVGLPVQILVSQEKAVAARS